MKKPQLVRLGLKFKRGPFPTIAAGPFSDVQIWSFSELDVLTPAQPVRANPARASCSPCPPPLQPRDHTHADRIRASDLRQRLAVTTAGNSLLPLVVGQLWTPTETHTIRHRPLPPLARPLADSSRSNSAMAASMVTSKRPCEVEVSGTGQGWPITLPKRVPTGWNFFFARQSSYLANPAGHCLREVSGTALDGTHTSDRAFAAPQVTNVASPKSRVTALALQSLGPDSLKRSGF